MDSFVSPIILKIKFRPHVRENKTESTWNGPRRALRLNGPYFLVLVFLFFGINLRAQKSPPKEKPLQELTVKKAKDSLKRLQDSIDFKFFNGNYNDVVVKSIDAIKFAKKNKDTAGAYYSEYMISAAFLLMEDYKNARKYAKKYAAYTQKVRDTFKLCRAYNLQGAIAVKSEHYQEALGYFKKGVPFSTTPKQLGLLYYNTSECYLNLKDIERAALYFKKAKKEFELVKSPGVYAEMNLLEGKLNLKQHKPEKALKNLENAIRYSEKYNYKDDYYVESYKEYSNALYATGKLKKAFQARKTYDSLNNAAKKEEKNKMVQYASAKYNVKGYREKLKSVRLQEKLSKQQVQKNKNVAYMTIGIAVFLIFVIFIFFKGYRKRKKLLLSLRKRNRQYLKAKNEAEQASIAKSKFFATVSHELRTPLYGVIGLSSILLGDKSLTHRKHDLEHLKFSADYLMALINDVLQISKIDSNTLEENQTSFNIKSLVETVTASFNYVMEQNKNTLQLHLDKEIPSEVIGNQMSLSQILMNLIGNASKFTQEGIVEVMVSVEDKSDDHVNLKFCVKDNGIGIAEEEQKSIFEEFAQSKDRTDQRSYQGTGLGLSIIKKLLEAAGAAIYLKSKKGEGSIFWFYLSYKIGEQMNRSGQQSQESLHVLKGKKILIVDDNHINQLVTKKILENHHMQASVAENGTEAIRLVQQENFDLILMDLNMPGKSGFETTEEIRRFNTAIPIIALTATEAHEIRLKVAACGMNDVVVKPYEVNDFLKIILRNLARENS